MSENPGTGLGIQPPPVPPGKGKTPGITFNQDRGTAAEAGEGQGGGDAGVLFPWYTVPPDRAEQWEDDAEAEEFGEIIYKLRVFINSALHHVLAIIHGSKRVFMSVTYIWFCVMELLLFTAI